MKNKQHSLCKKFAQALIAVAVLGGSVQIAEASENIDMDNPNDPKNIVRVFNSCTALEWGEATRRSYDFTLEFVGSDKGGIIPFSQLSARAMEHVKIIGEKLPPHCKVSNPDTSSGANVSDGASIPAVGP